MNHTSKLIETLLLYKSGKAIDSEFGIKAGAVAFLPKPLEICKIRTILQKYFVNKSY